MRFVRHHPLGYFVRYKQLYMIADESGLCPAIIDREGDFLCSEHAKQYLPIFPKPLAEGYFDAIIICCFFKRFFCLIHSL